MSGRTHAHARHQHKRKYAERDSNGRQLNSAIGKQVMALSCAFALSLSKLELRVELSLAGLRLDSMQLHFLDAASFLIPIFAYINTFLLREMFKQCWALYFIYF